MFRSVGIVAGAIELLLLPYYGNFSLQ